VDVESKGAEEGDIERAVPGQKEAFVVLGVR